MVFFTLFITVFNLALGYCLALCLQSRGIAPAWPSRLLERLGLLNIERASSDDHGTRANLPRAAAGESATAAVMPANGVRLVAINSAKSEFAADDLTPAMSSTASASQDGPIS